MNQGLVGLQSLGHGEESDLHVPTLTLYPSWSSVLTALFLDQVLFLNSFTLSSVQFSCSAAAAAAKSYQSCPTLCNPIDGSPPDSPIPGILQARTLE